MDQKPIEITLWPYDFNAIYDGRVEHFYIRFRSEFVKDACVLLKEFLPDQQVFSGRVLQSCIQEIIVYPYELTQDLYCTVYLKPIKTGTVI